LPADYSEFSYMAKVSVANLCRFYGAVQALHDVTFDVEQGEFLTLLGPSGCGKSTTLAALAGLDRPTSGRITIGNRVMFDGKTGTFIDAQFRNLGLMFQSYALWPHMTVYQNLDFTLELRRIRGAQAKQRIEEALGLVDMEQFADRYPSALSGGQQQRVALARTLVYRPELLLLDEPLSNLDAKLRERARIWLGDLQRRTGVTTVYVTHDQSEALALSNRIIVMNKGRIVQLGTPHEIYESPSETFVADFVGGSNLFKGQCLAGSPNACEVVLTGGTKLTVKRDMPEYSAGQRLDVAIRPERVVVSPTPGGENTFEATVRSVSYQGARHMVVASLGDEQFRIDTDHPISGSSLFVRFPPETLSVFPAA
jgi:iron(III) transport system ATP-binding protein